jgi:lysophospholipase L1-like esterase
MPPVSPPHSLRVACIGDSITYGALVRARRKNSYPAQLQALLGPRYLVRNFGASGCTMQKDGDLPYWDDRNFALSTGFQPGIVLILLGTNDTKAHNWQGVERFARDCHLLLDHYRALPSQPVVFLMTPPKQFIVGDYRAVNFDMSDERASALSTAIQRLGEEQGVPVIDIRAATAGHPECFLADGVHADAAGARLIAAAACRAILS